MNNKLFVFLVILLSTLIIAALVLLIMSINKFNQARYPDGKPSVLTDVPREKEPEEEKIETIVEIKYILPSDTEEIKEADLYNLDRDMLNKAYNEIFARYGHDFDSKDLRDYFTAQSWYKPVSGKKVGISDLSELENKNLNTIKARIDKLKEEEAK